MSDQQVKLPDDSANTGPKVDNTGVTSGPDTVLRQRIQLAGGALLELAIVRNDAPGASDYALVVRNIPSGTQAVSLASVPLPSGAATEATLASILAALVSTLTVSGTVAVSSSALPTGAATQTTLAAILTELQGTIDVALASLPLPSGAATETTLAAVNSKLGSPLPLPTGAATQTTLAAILSALGAALTVTGTVTVGSSALPTGAATEATLAALNAKVTAVNTGAVTVSAALPAGNNNIGDVDVVTQPARTRTADAIAVAVQTDAVMNGGTQLTPKWAAVSLAADGALVALVSGKKIRLLACVLNNAGSADGTLAIKSNNAGGTAITGAMLLRIGGGFVLPFNPTGWGETAVGEALYADLTTISALAGVVEYIEV